MEQPILPPLTKLEREEFKELSMKAFGKSSAWNKLLNNGELVEGTIMTKNNQIIKAKSTKYLTLTEIYNKMNEIVKNKENQNGTVSQS